jgi:hypothetical protein
MRKRSPFQHLERQLDRFFVEHRLRQRDRQMSARLATGTRPEVLASRPRDPVCVVSQGRRVTLAFRPE